MLPGSPLDDGPPTVSPAIADGNGTNGLPGGSPLGPGGMPLQPISGGPAVQPDGAHSLTVPNAGQVPSNRVFAANGDYLGPPGGLWDDQRSRNLEALGEGAKDTSEFWVKFPWEALSYIWGVGEALATVRATIFTAERLTAREAFAFGRRSLGAAEAAIPKLTRKMLSEARVIARGRNIDKIGKLVEKFGGQAKNWVKKSTLDSSTGMEIHWYEHPGIGRVGEKWAGFPDPF